MHKPLVSIIIPTCNRAHLIGETLDSVIAQTYTNWECIVVDDGSSDHTDEVLNEYCNEDSRIKFFHRPNTIDKGANNCRNFGFEHSKGQYVNWFDDDDLMCNDFIEECLIQLTSKELDFVISSYSELNNDVVKEQILINSNNLYLDYGLWKLKLITHSLIFRKSFIEDFSLFSNRIKRGQETEFYLRLFYARPNAKYEIIRKPLFIYRVHEFSKSNRNRVFNEDYKISVATIYSDNVPRSLFLKNSELVNYFYGRLVDIWFDSLRLSKKRAELHTRKCLIKIAQTHNILFFLKIVIIIYFTKSTNIDSYFLKKKLKTIQL